MFNDFAAIIDPASNYVAPSVYPAEYAARKAQSPLDPTALADRVPPSNCAHVAPSSALRLAGRLYRDPSTSYWLQQSLMSALMRDPVDAIDDVELLLSVLTARQEEIQGQGVVLSRAET